MKGVILTIGTALVVTVPATMGLIGNTSFAESVPVRVPPQATVVDHHGVDHKDGQRTTKTPEPGDDNSGQRTTKTPEPGDDKVSDSSGHGGDSSGKGGDSSGKGGGDDSSGSHGSGHQ